MFKKKDLLLIIPFLILGVCLLFWTQKSHDAGIAVIEENGSEIARYNLATQTQTEVIDIGGDYHVKLLLEPGKISFQSSDCPDQICVRTGKISSPGQVAVCLPAKVVVRIIGKNSQVDGTTG
ncbi:NusG domain II-containing protein [Caproicibacterium sp. BJN0003]|uniref:NusG domain II-containing protein n=1 Tax=Caproicibacterium sp. BJN0003 TaxID=2994078 RepID=UPI0022532D4B|nr:NusG domain II-containing protein [Caproicibacterium sp. BJN0003]UZT83061.1 NusG domain II-containing protein [Caproicibacterium sp. BJN0003]